MKRKLMKKIPSSIAFMICSSFIGNTNAVENSLNDANTDEPSQVEEKLTLNNPAQIQKVANIADGLIEAAEKALGGSPQGEMDVVAVAEFGNSDNRLVVPVPVSFQLTQK